MANRQTIALDAMGGDIGPDAVVPAAIRFAKKHPLVDLILVGDETAINSRLIGINTNELGLKVHHTTQVVSMDELPSQALRKKKDSSMRVAINLVKEGQADACVSAGNTGALMATGRYVLKTLPNIDRPAIIFSIPSIEGHTHMLDLGANLACTAEHLYQFGVMGSVLASSVDNTREPRVGLLNIGQEEIKGNETIKEAAALLGNSDVNYIGFVEGSDVYTGGVDVVVCDGFVGNVALKTSEGVAKLISHFMREEFSRNLLTRMIGLIAMPVLKGFKRKIDPGRYNGATLLGLRKTVIKSHGSADQHAFANAIEVALVEVEKDVPNRISQQLESRLGGG